MEQRVVNSTVIVKAIVKDKESYKVSSGNIFTLNYLQIQDVLKGDISNYNLSVITVGGEFENEMQVSFPAVQLQKGKEYVLFLEPDIHNFSNPAILKSNPEIQQLLVYADAQGAMEFQNGKYYDVLFHKFFEEEELYSLIQKINKGFAPKTIKQNTARLNSTNIASAVTAITSIDHTSTDGGTIDVSDFITITGSGFGATRGTNNVNFRNVDNGGATWISPISSDYTAWSDVSITVKVPEAAGTGQIDVVGTLSASVLTIGFTHLPINSSFAAFAESTRQRYYFRDKNGSGGYTFSLNSTSGFSGNPSAVSTLQDAMNTWTCYSGMNWDIGSATASAFAQDNENVVLFDATLPAGVLGRLTNRYNAGATGGCLADNTVWWLNEMDLQLKADPVFPGYTWEYGPSNPTSTEYDLESVLLHELGHAHGLGHRIAPGQTMHYALFNGVTARTLDSAEIRGAVEKMNYSKIATCFNPAGSGTPITAHSCSLSLPVELLHFDANKSADDVLVNWVTLSESNNDFFTIEKSINAIDFHSIGNTDGAGNSNRKISYEFLDEKPSAGYNYYRLKQTDFDGTFSYSRIAKVYFDAVDEVKMDIYPNPANDFITININELITDGLVSITDVKGALIYNEKITSVSEYYRKNLNISDFSNGIYLIKVITPAKSYISKFYKN